MIPRYLALGAFLALAACGSDANNPFDPTDDQDSGDNGEAGGDDGTPVSREGLPPGTASPAPNDGIFRKEERAENGNGFAQDIAYDGDTDTFTVDNIPFDGDTSGQSDYSRGVLVSSLGPFAVYENADPALDLINNRPITQNQYRAIYGVSESTNTEFAIVRTGSYRNYGFGGFVYQRNEGVTLPTTGQGRYEGKYAGMRDFAERPGLEYTTANAVVEIDFEDANDNQRGVRAEFTDRRIFDLAGQDLTQDVLASINAQRLAEDPTSTAITGLPMVSIDINTDTIDANGELLSDIYSRIDGEDYETGKFYGIVSGPNSEEIVGVMVLESDDVRFGDDPTTVRETGGFIVSREP